MFITCPHCNSEIEIVQINCGIFRHAQYKDGRDFNPHASKEECDNALKNGCAKPFELKDGIAVKCEYK